MLSQSNLWEQYFGALDGKLRENLAKTYVLWDLQPAILETYRSAPVPNGSGALAMVAVQTSLSIVGVNYTSARICGPVVSSKWPWNWPSGCLFTGIILWSFLLRDTESPILYQSDGSVANCHITMSLLLRKCINSPLEIWISGSLGTGLKPDWLVQTRF